MKEGWEYKKFEDALLKVKYTRKIQSSDYLPNGIVPIISQEETFISGYWDNMDDAFKVNSPVVIFGDHSRVVKYVDFDFVLGADGVKILKPIDGLNARFLYYFLKWYDVPSLGYSRHYKLLKEIDVPIPPLSEQQHIIEELDLLSTIIEKKKAQLSELDKLAQSIFYEMFGDPTKTSKGWEVKKIGDVCILKSGNSDANKSASGDLPYVKVGDMNLEGNETYIVLSSTYVDRVANARNIFPIGTIIFPKRGGAILTNKKRLTKTDICCDLNVMGVIPNTDIVIPLYVYYYFLRIDFSVFANTGSTIPQINNYDIAPMNIVLPPMDVQKQFASNIDSIEGQKELIKQSIKEVETMYNSRMDLLFNM